MGFKTYFTFCSCNEGIYNCCLASCCFFLFLFRLYCCTKTDQRRLIFLSPKMTGMQSRPSGNKSTSPQIKKKKLNACCLPWPALFHLWKQANQILWVSLHYCYFFFGASHWLLYGILEAIIIFMSCCLILYLSSDSVSLPFILDVGASSLWEIDRCIEYTGVQGIAVSGKDYFNHRHVF